jgi:endonuclease YncB( thermonuclease family)
MSQSDRDVEIEYLKDATYENTKPYRFHFSIAKVIKVYDGDTLHVAARVGSDICRFRCRIKGINCAELKDKDPLAFRAKEFTQEMCLGKIANIKIYPDQEKFGRLLVDINIDGRDLGEELIKNNLAKPFMV